MDTKRQRAARDQDVRSGIVQDCRVYFGHALCPTLWIAQGERKNVHACFCGTYYVQCKDPWAGSHEPCLDQEPVR